MLMQVCPNKCNQSQEKKEDRLKNNVGVDQRRHLVLTPDPHTHAYTGVCTYMHIGIYVHIYTLRTPLKIKMKFVIEKSM